MATEGETVAYGDRQRWLRMKERAQQRMATGPSYPDDPEDLAEQEAVTKALGSGQAAVRRRKTSVRRTLG